MANPRYAGRTSAAFEKIKANLRAAAGPCFHCGQTIDYALHYPHPDSFTVDHREPRSKHPELADDPANCVASHARCNWAKGAGETKLGLGNRSEDF